MHRLFSVLVTLGIIIWVFLLWQRAQPAQRVEWTAGYVDNANTADRCAQYRMTDGNDESTWALGYSGRIRQLVHGCL